MVWVRGGSPPPRRTISSERSPSERTSCTPAPIRSCRAVEAAYPGAETIYIARDNWPAHFLQEVTEALRPTRVRGAICEMPLRDQAIGRASLFQAVANTAPGRLTCGLIP
jgi:hypothetical protein